jgi:nitroimidazol reductase NimA-like FMN-containing flavoprotein (pyridoxamine 5'-phosphate oxidase superfamily)
VPLLRDDRLLGVLDVDSPHLNRFSAADRQGLERFAAILADGILRREPTARAASPAPMRRKDRQEDDIREIFGVIDRCRVLRVGFDAPDGPYIVPLNFGWEMDGDTPVFYMHCALRGRKLELLAARDRVGFEMDCSHALIEGPRACDYSYRYESIVGCGRAFILDDPEEKARALSKIMLHQAGREIPVSADQVDGVAVLCLRATQFRCKRRL